MAEAILGRELTEGDKMIIKYNKKDKPGELTFETKKGKAKAKKKPEKKEEPQNETNETNGASEESPEAKAEEGATE